MSDSSILLHGVSKVYRQYRSKRARVLEAIGIPIGESSYTEFVALDAISLEIKRGERVGIVGRNGAGKSTLLKLIAGMLQPSSGEVLVDGKVQALMELGTGFHPEFSGRANALSALAYQGVTGKRAQALLEDIVDFSELDEFFDMPLKTYSAGMSARLGFAAATAVRPEILIIDEILGAGDAYFAGKSSKRMRALTAQGTTVLFVSHDMTAVQLICDRAIWIERGRLIQDGEPIQTGRQYAASIRKQEELKLRAVNLKLSRGGLSELLTEGELDHVLVARLVCRELPGGQTPVRIYGISLFHGDQLIDTVSVGAAMDTDRESRIHLLADPKYMDWGKPAVDSNNRRYRDFGAFGGLYGHAPVVIKIPRGLGALSEFSITLEHGGSSPGQTTKFELFDGLEYIEIGRLQPASGDENSVSQSMRLSDAGVQLASIEKSHADEEFSYGEGSAWIENVDFLDHEGQSRRVFIFQQAMQVAIAWRARHNFSQLAFVVCVYGMDGQCVSQVVSPFVQSMTESRSGVVQANFDPLIIGKGDYVISIGIFDGMTEADVVGTKPLEVQDRQYRIRIVAPANISMDRGLVVHPVSWLVARTDYT